MAGNILQGGMTFEDLANSMAKSMLSAPITPPLDEPAIYGGMLDAAVCVAEAPKKGEPETEIYDPNDINSLSVDGYDLNASRYGGNKRNVTATDGLIDSDSLSGLVFFPRYAISDYSKDISNWRKQYNPYGTRGFFYFKIYFNFHTNYGLLGGSVNRNVENDIADTNTAYQYFKNIESVKIYESEKIPQRKKALEKFITSLRNISVRTPWFFKEINNLNNINPVVTDNGDFGTQSFNIVCSEESVDMRLGTLFDLYKFACFNSIRNKEILPANLRKFEMSILFMHIPLREYQTDVWSGMLNNKKEYDEKSLNLNITGNKAFGGDNTMSVKMLTFQNCEFDLKSMNELPDSVSNESSFDLGKNTIKINFDRVYEHRINEWEKIGFGQDGFMFDAETEFDGSTVTEKRLNYIADKIHALMIVPKVHADEKGIYENLYGNFTNIHSIYQTKKRNTLKEGGIAAGNIYEHDFGRVGWGHMRKNTPYLEKKLRNMEYDINDAPVNTLRYKWDANALNYNNNMIDVEGNPSNAHTFFGKLADSTWQRIKSGFGF